jgi:ABC-2 type transport system permease protein
MSKLWKVIRYEYRRHVFRKGFLIAVLSVPFWILLMVGVVFLLIRLESSSKGFGYVDLAGVLSNDVTPPEPGFPEKLIPMLEYSREEQARAALDAGTIDAYFVISPDYQETTGVRLVYNEQPRSEVFSQFRDFIRLNLLAELPEPVTNRVLEGADLRVQTIGESAQAQGIGVLAKFLAPLFAAIALMVAIFTSSGYLMQAVVEEKENRTMEIMITSMSPEQMMAGKVIGLIAVGLTQILIWLVFGLLGLFYFRDSLEILSGVNFDLSNLWLALVVTIPALVMVASLMAAVGATVTEAREGQQVTGLITIPVMLPFILFAVILSNPNGPLAVAMSFFPLTAPMTLLLRAGFGEIPTWQLVTSIAILILSAIGALWLAGRLFRVGMLRYGQRMRMREIFASLRGAEG